MLPILSVLLTPIVDLISGFFKGRIEIQRARQATTLAAEANRARLLADIESNNHSWEMAQLVDSDRWMRRFCFLLFSFPFIYAIFDPAAVQLYFTNGLSAIPAWFIQVYTSIVGAVWGISTLKNTIPAVISAVKAKKQ